MTAVWIVVVVVLAVIALVGVLLTVGSRHEDRRAGITDEEKDAEQRAWIDRHRRRRER